MLRKALGLALGASLALLSVEQARAALVFSESFDDPALSNGATIDTSNTGFSYVTLATTSKDDSQATVTTINPSSIGSDASAKLYAQSANADGTTALYLGKTGFSNPALQTVSFSLKLVGRSKAGGDFTIGLVNNTNTADADTGNNINDGYAWRLAVPSTDTNGNIRDIKYASGSNNKTWTTLAGTGIAQDTAYNFVIYVNNSGSDIDQNGVSIANGTMDLYINDVLVGDDLPIFKATNDANALRVALNVPAGSRPNASFELDNIGVWDNITAIPEPASFGLIIPGMLLWLGRRRRS